MSTLLFIGKRINYSLRQSYTGRCNVATVTYNAKKPVYAYHKLIHNKSPGIFTKRKEERIILAAQATSSRRRGLIRRQLFPANKTVGRSDPSYGDNSEKPDMAENDFEAEKEKILSSLLLNEEERTILERETVDQSLSNKWVDRRRKMLTASNFGKIIKMRQTTTCQSFVQNHLFGGVTTTAMEYGKSNEETALRVLERILNVQITKCGIFVDSENPFLGATPDGLIGNDGIVEVKCPSSAEHLTPEEGIIQKKITFWMLNKSGEISGINKKHNWYFQVQGQLNVCQKSFCQFAVWTPKGIKIEKIERDEVLWKSMMVEKLKYFYLNCILPELADSRFLRSMPIRNPKEIIDAQEKKLKRKVKLIFIFLTIKQTRA